MISWIDFYFHFPSIHFLQLLFLLLLQLDGYQPILWFQIVSFLHFPSIVFFLQFIDGPNTISWFLTINSFTSSFFFFPAIDFLIWLFLTLIPITSPWLFPLKLTSDASSHPFDYFSIWFLQLLLDYFLFNWLMHIPYVWWFLDLIPLASAQLFPLQLTDTSSLPFDDFSIWFLQLPSILSSAIDWWITSSIWIWRTDVFIPCIMYNLSPLLGADESSR